MLTSEAMNAVKDEANHLIRRVYRSATQILDGIPMDDVSTVPRLNWDVLTKSCHAA